MKMNFYSVYDSATNAYMRPFCFQTDGQALRSFGDEAVRADSEISKHPEDYSLFRIGSFDDAEGELIGCAPHCLARAHELAAQSRQRQPQLDLVVGDQDA